MDQIRSDFARTFDKLKINCKSLNYNLAQLNVLSDSLKSTKNGQFDETIVSALCTKWMQLNESLRKLPFVNIGQHYDENVDMQNFTANHLILYLMLDEYKLNDSKKPVYTPIKQYPNVPGSAELNPFQADINVGFISHIIDGSRGTVFIVNAKLLDQYNENAFFGPTLKPLSHQPQPGEMFAYVFQNKYLFRVVRKNYESSLGPINHYTGICIDIGVELRISIDDPNQFEVTEVAKAASGFAVTCHIYEIPYGSSIYDLLHTRVQYQMLCVNKIINILRIEADPFAPDQRDQWHFCKYFMPNFLNELPAKKSDDISSEPSIATDCHFDDPTEMSLNPFLDASLDDDETIIDKPITDKDNPFYIDVNENKSRVAPKTKLSFAITRCLNNLSDEWIEQNLPQLASSKAMESAQAGWSQPVVQKPPAAVDLNVSPNVAEEASIKVIEQKETAHVESRATDQGKQSEDTAVLTQLEVDTKSESSDKLAEPEQSSPTEDTEPTVVSWPQFVQPDHPKVGQKIKLHGTFVVSVTEFYAQVMNDPSQVTSIKEFTDDLNSKEHVDHFVQYDTNDLPKVHDKVIVIQSTMFYRGKVVAVVDHFTLLVFFVDYGDCAKVNITEMFKYEDKWDKHPVYALHFRINRIKERKPWDYEAKFGLEYILYGGADATIVGIDHWKDRTTFIVDLLDENLLDLANTLMHKNFAELDVKSTTKRMRKM